MKRFLMTLVFSAFAYGLPSGLTAYAGDLYFFQVQTGYGSFRDLQLPFFGGESDFLPPEALRADGTSTSSDNGVHQGLPMAIDGTYRLYSRQRSFDLVGSFLTIKHLEGDTENSASSFSRFSLSARPAIKKTVYGVPARLGGLVDYRRHDYSNVSSGHYISGIYLGGMIQAGKIKSLRVESSFVFGANPELHFLAPDDGVWGSPVNGATSTHQSLKIEASRLFSGGIVGVFGYEMDSTRVEMESVFAYREFGLQVSPVQQINRTYVLDTEFFLVGLRKVL